MGKRIIPQRRGKGNPRYRAKTHKCKGQIKYPRDIDYSKSIGGQVTELLTDSGRTAPIAKVMLEDFQEILVIAPEGMQVGQWIQFGTGSPQKNGCVMPLGKIKEGVEVYNIEISPGDGGKLVRSGGASAQVVSHDKTTGLTQVRLPSKKTVMLKSESLATIGRISAGGRKDKPLIHAGQAYYANRSKGKLYPKVCGRAMNAVDHPHGGGRHPHVGKPTTVSRNTSPGRKVGHIAAKKTGLRKRG